MTSFASCWLSNHSLFRHASRSLPLKLSTKPFCQRLRGLMWAGPTFWSRSHFRQQLLQFGVSRLKVLQSARFGNAHASYLLRQRICRLRRLACRPPPLTNFRVRCLITCFLDSFSDRTQEWSIVLYAVQRFRRKCKEGGCHFHYSAQSLLHDCVPITPIQFRYAAPWN